MSPPSTSTPLRNAVSIFIAHFHVRRGNELVWYKGEDDLAGVEWKVLPSGSHAVEKDIIYFEAPPSPNNISRIGVAAFRNHKIAQGVRTGVGDWEEDDDQRGARMMAVGAILECGEPSTPWSLLAATLPHLSRLEGLVDAISADPSCRNLLVEWFEMHKTLHDGAKHVVERDSHLQSSFYDQDPILQLPAITNALGPLLPSLLKRLILPRFRLLLYVPPGTPTFRAAAIGFALGELAYAACQSEQVEQSSAAAQCPVVGKSIKQHGLRILGLIGLYDIAKLQNEQEEHRASQTSWIAMTTDKILLEKCDLYDAMLDLSPLATSGGSDDLLATPSALPCLMSTHRFISKDGKPKAELKKQSWTAREFAIFRGLDEQASLYAVSSRARRRSPSGHRSSQISLPARSPPHELSPTKHLRSQGRTSVLLAYLRFWLANMWILPYQWRFNLRESYGYVPLSIRSDGGVRASIMLLPDVESDEDDDGDDDESSEGQGGERGGEEEEDQEQAAVGESRQSPVLKRHYGGEHALSFSDEEDDPILAACGATQASSRQRKSRSHSSVSKSGSQQLDGSHDRIVSPNDLLKVPSHGGNVEQEGVQEGLKESVRLSLAIFELWSLWVKELVIEVRHLVEDKVLKEQESNEDETLQDSDTSLLQGDQRSIVITSEEIYDLRLSASILIDTQLILYLASTVTTRPIAIQQSWWSRASCLWS